MEKLFKKWFEVVYRDKPEKVDEIVSVWQKMVANEEATWSGREIFADFLLHNELADGSHFFAIDWKDADELMAYFDDVAARFEINFDWTKTKKII